MARPRGLTPPGRLFYKCGTSRQQVVVATKTYASTATGARRSVTKALRELGVGTVDIFLLHAVDSAGELEAKLPALEVAGTSQPPEEVPHP